jgi:DNA-binding response OmpR family regulator
MSETSPSAVHRSPVVYFIDDSATMREVIKIAFRKEDIHVIACHNAASAIAQFEQTPPNAVITDVIMPDQDGYEVCQFVKSHPQFSAAPVILMSGVVNRSVAERAMAVKADELMRKPFQPADLIARVRGLLNPKLAAEPANLAGAETAGATSSVTLAAFVWGAGVLASATRRAPAAAAPPRAPAHVPAQHAQQVQHPAPNPPQAPRPLVAAAQQRVPGLAGRVATPLPAGVRAPGAPASAPPPADVARLQNEIRRLEMLVKKLRAELEAEREYRASLEAQLQTAQEMS